MAIKRLQREREELGRFPSLGKLRKGDVKQGNKPGRDLDCFRFTSEREDIQACFEEAFGAKPVALTVFLPYKKLDDNFSTWQEDWEAGGLKHRCDGETCVLWWDEKRKVYSHEPKACPGKCKPVGRLNFFIPELLRAGFVGFVTMETHGDFDMRSIMRSLKAVVDERGTDDLTGIAFTLRRTKSEITYLNAEGKRQHRSIYLVQLVPAVEWVRLQLTQQRKLAQLPGGTDPLPTEQSPAQGTVIDAETGEVIEPVDAEFEMDDDESEEIAVEEAEASDITESDGLDKPTPLEVHLDWTKRFLDKAVPACQKIYPDFAMNDALDALDVMKIGQIAEGRVKDDREFSAKTMQAKLLAYAQELAHPSPLGQTPAGVTPIETEERF